MFLNLQYLFIASTLVNLFKFSQILEMKISIHVNLHHAETAKLTVSSFFIKYIVVFTSPVLFCWNIMLFAHFHLDYVGHRLWNARQAEFLWFLCTCRRFFHIISLISSKMCIFDLRFMVLRVTQPTLWTYLFLWVFLLLLYFNYMFLQNRCRLSIYVKRLLKAQQI